jgi:hypothetical protein
MQSKYARLSQANADFRRNLLQGQRNSPRFASIDVQPDRTP